FTPPPNLLSARREKEREATPRTSNLIVDSEGEQEVINAPPDGQDIITPPSTSLNGEREAKTRPELKAVPSVMSKDTRPTVAIRDEVRHEPANSASNHRRSLRLQLRYFRSLYFAGWLFLRLVFWYILMPKVIGQKAVDRRNMARWVKYSREFRG